MTIEGLRVVDGFNLPEEYRVLLRPGEVETDSHGNIHHLPRFFYEITSWQEAHEIRLARHFRLSELMLVDCREARLLLGQFPHYVPCAIALLATWLRIFAAKSMRRFSSVQMAATGRRHIRLAAQKAFIPGERLRTYTGSETLFSPMRSRLRNMGLSRRRLV